MQHINRRFEFYRIDRTIGIAVKIVDQLNRSRTETFQRLGRRRMLARLGKKQFEAKSILNLRRETSIVLPA